MSIGILLESVPDEVSDEEIRRAILQTEKQQILDVRDLYNLRNRITIGACDYKR